jgi:hypothetical protein
VPIFLITIDLGCDRVITVTSASKKLLAMTKQDTSDPLNLYSTLVAIDVLRLAMVHEKTGPRIHLREGLKDFCVTVGLFKNKHARRRVSICIARGTDDPHGAWLFEGHMTDEEISAAVGAFPRPDNSG